MEKRIFLIVLFPALVLTACHNKRKEVQPQLRLLTEAVYASGTLVPENEYKVVSSTDGFLQKALVKEGDSVKKGQLLFILSNNTQQTQVSAALEVVTKTIPVAAPDAPAFKDFENRLASARIRLENDELQYKRYKNLYEQNAISASNYEKYKLQYETTLHEIKSLEEQLRQQQLSAALQLQEAGNQLQIARTSRGNGLLRSYAEGMVYDVYKQTGDLIAPSQPIALIGSGRMIARLLVDEDDLSKVRRGQKILITMDAYPNKMFHAHIGRIYPLLNKQEQSFRVDALFDDEIPVKIYGLNVEANIILHENEKVLVIPKNALMKGDSVLVKESGKIAKIKVRKGAEDTDFVEVPDGLNNSSILIIEQ